MSNSVSNHGRTKTSRYHWLVRNTSSFFIYFAFYLFSFNEAVALAMVNILDKCSVLLPSSCIFDRCRVSDRYSKAGGQSSRDCHLSATREQFPLSTRVSGDLSKKLLKARYEQETYNHPRRRSLDQCSSKLISSLPVELRVIIYRNVFCVPVPVVHIVKRKDGSLCHVRCRAADGECGTYRCYNDYSELSRLTSGVSLSHLKDGGQCGSLLALLLSCKKVYFTGIFAECVNNAEKVTDIMKPSTYSTMAILSASSTSQSSTLSPS